MIHVDQDNGWMDERTMIDWAERVWEPCAASIDGPKLLIIDKCTAHVATEVRREITSANTELEIIPGGCTPKLQVMDVSLNKPFKCRLCCQVESFLAATELGTIPK